MEGRWYVVANRPMHALVSEHALRAQDAEPDTAAHSPPIVLVHGLGKAAESLRQLAEALDRLGHAVYAPDLPGFGESSKHKPPSPLDVPGLADALDAWMEAAGIGRAVVVGNSIGAQVAADLAARRPQRALAVVLLGPTTDPKVRSMPAQVWRWLVNSRRDRSAAGGGMVSAYWRAGIGRVAQTFRYSVVDRIEEKLPKISAPALVIAGSVDPITPLAWTRRVSELLPHGRIVVLDGAAHSMHGNQPREVAAHVHEFVASLASD
jgi:2-hydroxy-6-oxonona-2,4-dienedioate hydrolase